MASLVPAPSFAPEVGLTPTLALEMDESRLRVALLAVLASWAARPAPASSFQFVVREEKERDAFALFYVENDGSKEPFVLADFEIHDGRIWLMQNNTDIDFGEELIAQGVAQQEIRDLAK